MRAKHKSVAASTGLIVSFIALTFSWVPIVNNLAGLAAILGILLGVSGVISTRDGGTRSGRGMAATAVAVAVIALTVVMWTQRMYGEAIDGVARPAVSPSAIASPPSAVAWGTTTRFMDGILITCGPPAAFVRSSYGVGGEGMPLFRRVRCTLTNTGSAAYDPTLVVGSMSAGGAEGSRVFQSGLTSLTSPILPGRSVSWTMGWGITAPDRIQVTISAFSAEATFYNPKEN